VETKILSSFTSVMPNVVLRTTQNGRQCLSIRKIYCIFLYNINRKRMGMWANYEDLHCKKKCRIANPRNRFSSLMNLRSNFRKHLRSWTSSIFARKHNKAFRRICCRVHRIDSNSKTLDLKDSSLLFYTRFIVLGNTDSIPVDISKQVTSICRIAFNQFLKKLFC